MNEKELVTYYNKFKEDKRLDTKHAKVEFYTALKYIEKYLKKESKILDVGAGTGKYSIYFKNKGYYVEAVELVKQNINTFKKNDSSIIIHQASAVDMKMIEDKSFDVVLLFGPMYHLISIDEKVKALSEAKRIVKDDGYIFISYCMADYAIITHGIKEGYLKDAFNNKEIDDNFNIISKSNDLYSYVRMDTINYLKDKLNLKRVQIISQDGCAEYYKKEINKMDDETFDILLKYHFSVCESPYLLEASRHILDILKP